MGPSLPSSVAMVDREIEQLEGWRADCLLHGGFDVEADTDSIWAIAHDLAIDYRDAVALFAKGCPPELIVEILS